MFRFDIFHRFLGKCTQIQMHAVLCNSEPDIRKKIQQLQADACLRLLIEKVREIFGNKRWNVMVV